MAFKISDCEDVTLDVANDRFIEDLGMMYSEAIKGGFLPHPKDLPNEEEQKAEDLKKTLEKIFIPNWNNKPPEMPPVLSLMGVNILTAENITAIIAAPGAGKSSLSEAVCAWHLNFTSDALGFEGDPNFKGVIYCDFERTNQDVWNSFNRMARRAGVPFGGSTDKVIIAGMRSIPRLSERMDAIVHLVKNNPCSLLILDGAGDLVIDTNDLPQAIECRIQLRELTVDFNLSIFTTLHPNPGSTKPRGHIGSEICREAECVFLAKKVDGDIHILTTNFEHGKNRNGSDLTTAYKWDIEEMMFVSVDAPLMDGAEKTPLKKAYEVDDLTHKNILAEIFADNLKPKLGVLKTRISTYYGKSLGTKFSDRRIDEFLDYAITDNGWITKVGKDRSPSAYYYLTTQT